MYVSKAITYEGVPSSLRAPQRAKVTCAVTANMGGRRVSGREKIYHLLCGAFCQGVAIAQIIDLDVLDVVTVGDVDFAVKFGRLFGGGRSRGFESRSWCG